MTDSGLIRNALVCDGSGKPVFPADVRFEHGVVTEVGPRLPEGGGRVFDAEGLLLTPGFIDAHAHSDVSILASPEAFGKISQGVTTEISGNCGLSAFPVLTGEVREHLERLYRNYHVKISWSSFPEYLRAVEKCEPAVNPVFLCGFNTLRANVLGYGDSPNGPNDWLRMRSLLAETLAEGAAGLSTGLLYLPGKFASEEELSTVASALRGTGKPHATHLRSEGATLFEAFDEAVKISRSGSGILQLSHMKTAGKQNWNKIDGLFERISSARAAGLSIHADRYPYIWGQTSLSVVLPPPWDRMTDSAILDDLRSSPEKQRLLTDLLRRNPPDWHSIILCSTAHPRGNAFAGERFDELCRKLGADPCSFCTELMAFDATGTMAAFGGMSETNLRRIVRSDFVCCGTDETARPADFSIGRSHPRGFGAFPEFFRIAVETLGIPETVRKMTSLPAEIFRLRGRGLVRPGYAADFVLLNPESFRSAATFANPHLPAEGIRSVFVNGVESYSSGRVLRRAGRVLKSGF